MELINPLRHHNCIVQFIHKITDANEVLTEGFYPIIAVQWWFIDQGAAFNVPVLTNIRNDGFQVFFLFGVQHMPTQEFRKLLYSYRPVNTYLRTDKGSHTSSIQPIAFGYILIVIFLDKDKGKSFFFECCRDWGIKKRTA